MKKVFNLLFVVAIVFITFSCSTETAADPDKILAERTAKAGVSVRKAYQYTPDDTEEFLQEVIEYNKNGQVVKRETFNKEPVLQQFNKVEFNIYDDKGFLIEKKFEDTKGTILRVVKYKYEKDLLAELLILFSDGELLNKVVYARDKHGNATEISWYDSNNKLESKELRKYEKGEMTELSYYDEEELFETTRLIENKKGEKTYQSFDENNELLYEIVRFSNKEELMTKELYKEENKVLSKTIYAYDDNNLIKKTIEYINDEQDDEKIRVTFKYKYKYFQ